MQRKDFTLAAGVVLVLLCWGQATAQDKKGADPYPQSKESEIGGQKVKLVKTGQAIRKKTIFNSTNDQNLCFLRKFSNLLRSLK